MDAHRSRSLGMAALIFILISLTAALFHGAAPVRADDVAAADLIEINGDTARVTVNLYKDVNHTKPLGSDAVLSTDTLYGAFSAIFNAEFIPTADKHTAVYTFPDTIDVKDNAGGDLWSGEGSAATKAGTWRIEKKKLFFIFDTGWLQQHPSDVHVAADFAFELANKNVGSGDSTKVNFPGAGEIDITTKDGDVSGTKEGKFSQSGGEGRVTWTLKLQVESHASNVQLTDVLGENFSFVSGSFKLNDQTLDQQLTINGQTATLSLGDLSQGTHTITYDSVLSPNVSLDNYAWINELDGSKNKALLDQI